MIQRLVVLHRFIGAHDLAANVAGIGKISLEVFRFQMIPHILSRFMIKTIANTTSILFQRIISHQNVLIKVLRVCYVTS